MFQTNIQWEETSNIEFFRSLMQRPGLRRYSMVELSVNCSIIHLDIFHKAEPIASGVYSRFQVINFSAAVSALRQEECIDAHVSIQIRDRETNTYTIHPIIQIIESVDKNGDPLLFYRRENQKIYVEGTDLPGTLEAPAYLLWSKSTLP